MIERTPKLAIRLFEEDRDPTATHHVMGTYVERYWGARLGPTSICAIRRMVELADESRHPAARRTLGLAGASAGVDVGQLADLLGVTDLPNKVWSTLERLDRFSPVMVRRLDDEYTMVAIPTRWSTIAADRERKVERAQKAHKLTA